MLVIPKSFSFAQIIYPSEARNQVAFSCGRRGTTVVVDEELDCAKDTSSVSLRLPPSPTGEGLFRAPESPSDFPDKHCFCGHKSEAPREAGLKIILIVLKLP